MNGQAQSGPHGDVDHPQSYDFHPLSEVFPLLGDSALSELADDIREHGLREPIITHEGLILDGRNRYRACQRAEVTPQYREFNGSDPVAYVISVNLHRRHLNESQRSMVAAKLATLRDGQRQVGQLAQVPTQSQAAALLNTSQRSVKRAAVVRNHGSPELVEAVERGDISVSRAANEARKEIEQRGTPGGRPGEAGEVGEFNISHPTPEHDSASEKPRRASTPNDDALSRFNDHVLELRRTTARQKVERFAKTAVPADDLAELGQFFTELAQLKKSRELTVAVGSDGNGMISAEESAAQMKAKYRADEEAYDRAA
jgi:hypothetical protein